MNQPPQIQVQINEVQLIVKAIGGGVQQEILNIIGKKQAANLTQMEAEFFSRLSNLDDVRKAGVEAINILNTLLARMPKPAQEQAAETPEKLEAAAEP